MTTTDYVINIALIALVLMQIRDRKMDLRSLLLPVVAVAGAALYYLKGVPTTGNDVLLDIVTGTVALTTRVWRGEDGIAHAKAGAVAATLWVVGVGFRLAFEEFSSHGGGASITRFSIDHSITGSNAWVAALVIMALAEVISRLVVLRLRGAGTGQATAAARLAQ